jgi:hypothetical protein
MAMDPNNNKPSPVKNVTYSIRESANTKQVKEAIRSDATIGNPIVRLILLSLL